METLNYESLVVVQPIVIFPVQSELHELVCTHEKFRKSQSIFSVNMFHDEYEVTKVMCFY